MSDPCPACIPTTLLGAALEEGGGGQWDRSGDTLTPKNGGSASVPGTGSESEQWGSATTSNGDESLTAGRGAIASSNETAVIGRGGEGAGDRSTLISRSADDGGHDDTVIAGRSAMASGAGAIGLGAQSDTPADTLLLQPAQTGDVEAVIGNGVNNSSPVDMAVSATGGSGTDTAGADLGVRSGTGTGAGDSGHIGVDTAAPSGSGGTANTPVTRMRVRGDDGAVEVTSDGRRRTGASTPSAFSTNQTAWDPGTGVIQRVSASVAGLTVSGIVAADDRCMRVVNVGTRTIRFTHEDSGATAANRLLLPGGHDVVLPPDGSASLWYDPVTDRWRLLAIAPYSLAQLRSGLYGSWRADAGVTLNRQGPHWPSQPSQTHARGLAFDGTSDYVLFGDAASDPYADYTLVILFKKAWVSAFEYPWSEDGTGTSFFGFSTHTNGAQVNKALVQFHTTQIYTTADVIDDAWHTLIVNVSAGKAVQLYVDGVADASSSHSQTWSGTPVVRCGRGASGGYSDQTVAWAIRGTASLSDSATKAGQIHNYIRAAVAGDGISLPDAGETATLPSGATAEWRCDDDADGHGVTDYVGSATGVRYPGDTASAVADLSAAGRDLSQATAAEQPRWVVDEDGLPGLVFEAGTSLSVSVTPPSDWPVQLGAVFDTGGSVSAEGLVLALVDTDNTDRYVAIGYDASGNTLLTADDTTGATDLTTGALDDGDTHMVVAECDSDTYRAVYLDGDAASAADTTSINWPSGVDTVSLGVCEASTPFSYADATVREAWIATV